MRNVFEIKGLRLITSDILRKRVIRFMLSDLSKVLTGVS
jgi:hypothetical protein